MAAFASTAALAAPCPPHSTPETHVFASGLCLAVNSFGVEAAGPAPLLVVVVHGDISDGGRATYHATFARRIARPGLVAVALMRPGYADAEGRTSDGDLLGRYDNYTSQVVTAVGGAVAALRRHYRARRVVYIGHSGGAAIGGVLIGRRPGLVDDALLVSCPCDLSAWLRSRGRPPWRRSLSPSGFVHKVSPTTRVLAMTGEDDVNTLPDLARAYAAALARRGITAAAEIVPGAGHGFGGLASAVEAALHRILRE